MRIRKWDEGKFGEMNFLNICQLFSDGKLNLQSDFFGRLYLIKGKKQFVVQVNRWKKERDCGGWLREQTWFVLQGECEITIDSKIYSLKKGDFLKLPTGSYRCKPIENEIFEYVWACELPKKSHQNIKQCERF